MMRLVFIHGWGFDRHFWQALRPHLAKFDSIDVELGFLGEARTIPDFAPKDVLIGHSLGFLWGITHYPHWHRWVAINSFARFVGDCVPKTTLRVMQRNLQRDAAQTLATLYTRLGYQGALPPLIDEAALSEGLDWLATRDATTAAPASKGLVIASTQDPLVPPSASEALAAKIVWMPAATHLLPIQEPHRCAKSIQDFLT